MVKDSSWRRAGPSFNVVRCLGSAFFQGFSTEIQHNVHPFPHLSELLVWHQPPTANEHHVRLLGGIASMIEKVSYAKRMLLNVLS